ncbi:OmpA family protein [Thaumasiovibrio subtropicus]|uniref:OmpA family protein n=1 Tax=Thaumasiovibrio subtropicus TaxID=1891207 RepID=UPI000B35F80F|nr:OmpA family protein [Thaumasiovibrio subtropicus]
MKQMTKCWWVGLAIGLLSAFSVQAAQIDFDCQVGQQSHRVSLKATSLRQVVVNDGHVLLRESDIPLSAWHSYLLEELAAAGVGEHCARVVLAHSEMYVETNDDGSQVVYVYFDFDKAHLTPRAKQTLMARMALLRDAEMLTVSGHTDSIGSNAYNLDLGMARAKSVQAFLLLNGVDSQRLQIESFGENVPVMTNQDAAGRSKNRRVAVKWIIAPPQTPSM